MWATLAEVVKAVAPAITAVVACIGVWIAYKGLTKWQAELLGKRKTELAEDALATFYEAKDIMEGIRSAGGFPSEGRTRETARPEEPHVKELRDRYYVTIERYVRHREFFAALRAKRYRMRAVFGPEAEEAYRRLDSAINITLSSARSLIRTAPDLQSRIQGSSVEKWEAAIWRTGEDDPIDHDVDEAVRLIEKVCRPVLEISR